MHAAYNGRDDAFALTVDKGVDCAWTSSADGNTIHEQAKDNWDISRCERSYVHIPYDQILGKLHKVDGARHDSGMRTTALQTLIEFYPNQHAGCLSTKLADLILTFVLESWWESEPYCGDDSTDDSW